MIGQTIRLGDAFEFEAGGSLEGLQVAFHTSSKDWDGQKKVVWICHALTANSDPEDWWPQLVGSGKLLDPEKHFIVCANILGSPYGTSGPSTTDPKTGRPYFFSFPKFTIRDIIKATVKVREHLGIGKIDLLIGSSIGGFQAVEWAVMEPTVISRLALLATDVRVSPWLGASVEAQRMALQADGSFLEAADLAGGREGLKCARAQALISYRCFRGYKLTQSETDPDTLFAGRVASYERYQGEKLAKRFDAYSYWSLCNTLDSHNVGRGRGGVGAALSTIKARTRVAAVDTDGLFPPEEMSEWTSMIPGADFSVINSDFGHDGFLLETDQVGKVLRPFVEEL